MSDYLKQNDYVDAYALSRDKDVIEGAVRLKDMKRLSAMCLDSDNVFTYHIKGIVGRLGWPGAVMTVAGVLPLTCQRCNKPMELPIESEVVFRFAKSEAEADSIPIEEDDDTEVIVGSHKLNLMDWIEEELILSIPIVPVHKDGCEVQSEIKAEEPEQFKKENPFAKLKELKGLRKS